MQNLRPAPRFSACLAALVCALILCLPAKAQIGEARRSIAVGVNAGIAMNNIGFDPKIKQNLHMGPTFGVTARFTSEKYFNVLCALQLELNYAMLGWNENVLNANSEPLPDTYRRDQHYVQLPVLARLAMGNKKETVLGYFLAGPQVGYCFKESTKQSDFTLNAAGIPDRPNSTVEQYDLGIEKRFDYGITAGLGLEIATKAGRFLIEGRYYYGLSDIFKNSKKDTFSRSNNGTIVAKVTYLINIRK